jgi:hypothetical protein
MQLDQTHIQLHFNLPPAVSAMDCDPSPAPASIRQRRLMPPPTTGIVTVAIDLHIILPLPRNRHDFFP